MSTKSAYTFQLNFALFASLYIDETIVRGCMSSSEGRCDTREHCLICDGAGCNLLVHTDPSIPDAPSSSGMVHFTVVLLASMAMAVVFAQ